VILKWYSQVLPGTPRNSQVHPGSSKYSQVLYTQKNRIAKVLPGTPRYSHVKIKDNDKHY